MMIKLLTSTLILICLIGCGGSNGGYSGPLGQVSGKITSGGKPIPQGSQVVFQTKEGSNYMATGTVGANGEYSLNYDAKKNLPAMTYIATVLPPTKTGAPAKMSPDQMANPGQVLSATTTEAPPFPDRYSSALNSGLEYTVKAGKNTYDVDLELR
jgi:hypothetical protein